VLRPPPASRPESPEGSAPTPLPCGRTGRAGGDDSGGSERVNRGEGPPQVSWPEAARTRIPPLPVCSSGYCKPEGRSLFSNPIGLGMHEGRFSLTSSSL